jgi:intracellular multiplication protein IcmL
MAENKKPSAPVKPTGGAKANPRKFRSQTAAPASNQAAAPSSHASQRKTVKGTKREDIGKLGAVVIRNEFYKDGYRSILKLAVFQSLIILSLIGAMFFVIHIHQPENRYFATTEDGRLIPMVPLSEPNLSTPALMSWVAQSTTEVMTFGFNDFKRRLQEASRNFTKAGWESFTTALQRSRIIEMVEENQQVVTAAPQGAPILQQEGVVQGRYQWVVQVPIAVTYQSGAQSRSDFYMVTVVVVRVSRLESPNGVGIEQWITVAR